MIISTNGLKAWLIVVFVVIIFIAFLIFLLNLLIFIIPLLVLFAVLMWVIGLISSKKKKYIDAKFKVK
jgi:hypothetical protein